MPETPELQLNAPICEVFTSAQGEGLLVGVRQVFVRLRGCNLHCCYCDTPQARTTNGPCSIEDVPGSGRFTQRGNPISVGQLLQIIDSQIQADDGIHHSIALTGGEPLLYPEYLCALASALQQRDQRIYLETAGHLPEALAKVLPAVDYTAMDWKLPSTLDKPLDTSQQTRFLHLAQQRECFIKMPVTDNISEEEVHQALRAISEVTRAVPLVLQPVTPGASGCRPPDAQTLLQWQAVARKFVDDVRIIPQCHRLIGMR